LFNQLNRKTASVFIARLEKQRAGGDRKGELRELN
jgi:hypothetical protein